MKELIGKKVVKVEMAGDSYMRFITDTGEKLDYYTDGDCCSASWFAGIMGLDKLLGYTVVSVADRDMPDDINDHPEHDCLRFYGLAITTEKGNCDIEYRNASNGYYGGSCEFVSDMTWNKPAEPKEFNEITADFSS